VITLAVLVAIGVIDFLDGGLEMIGINIARCNNLAVRQGQEGFRVAGSLPPHADHAEIDPVIG